MNKKTVFICLALVLGFSSYSCSGKKTAEEQQPPIAEQAISNSSAPATDENVMGDSDNGKAVGLQTVNYPYDSFVLDGTAKKKLKENAEILKSKPTLKIQIEGHCDMRGGIQYNLALGEKRANAAKNFLIDQGVGSDKISTISYGKERLLDSGDTESAHAKNRRANFVITAR